MTNPIPAVSIPANELAALHESIARHVREIGKFMLTNEQLQQENKRLKEQLEKRDG